MKKLTLFLAATFFFLLSINAQESTPTDEQTSGLAKATQNPLAAMYSLPFQNNTTFGIGDENKSQNVLNIQPIIPISFSKVNLISRIIAPIITQPYVGENGESKTGLGDISYTAWLSPSKASTIIWGVGPVLQIPTAKNTNFGSGEFGAGPSIIALTMIDKWVAGIVVNNVWTFGDVAENKFLFQYFINYNLPHAAYIVSAPIMTANWNAESSEQWTIPVGGGIGKVFKFGDLPVNINAQAYYNAVRPHGWGDWQSRIQVQFLFPTKAMKAKMQAATK